MFNRTHGDDGSFAHADVGEMNFMMVRATALIIIGTVRDRLRNRIHDRAARWIRDVDDPEQTPGHVGPSAAHRDLEAGRFDTSKESRLAGMRKVQHLETERRQSAT